MGRWPARRFAIVAGAMLVVAAAIAIAATIDHNRKNTAFRHASNRWQLCERWGGACGPNPEQIEDDWNARERRYVISFFGALMIASGFTGAALARRSR